MGSLPPTYRSTARHDDPISGQRLYRVPVGMLFRSGIKFPELKIGHIDTIQPHLRLMAAWPSTTPRPARSIGGGLTTPGAAESPTGFDRLVHRPFSVEVVTQHDSDPCSHR